MSAKIVPVRGSHRGDFISPARQSREGVLNNVQRLQAAQAYQEDTRISDATTAAAASFLREPPPPPSSFGSAARVVTVRSSLPPRASPSSTPDSRYRVANAPPTAASSPASIAGAPFPIASSLAASILASSSMVPAASSSSSDSPSSTPPSLTSAPPSLTSNPALFHAVKVPGIRRESSSGFTPVMEFSGRTEAQESTTTKIWKCFLRCCCCCSRCAR